MMDGTGQQILVEWEKKDECTSVWVQVEGERG